MHTRVAREERLLELKNDFLLHKTIPPLLVVMHTSSQKVKVLYRTDHLPILLI